MDMEEKHVEVEAMCGEAILIARHRRPSVAVSGKKTPQSYFHCTLSTSRIPGKRRGIAKRMKIKA